MSRTSLPFFCIGLLFLFPGLALAADKIQPELKAHMATVAEDAFIPVAIRFEDQFDAYAFMDWTRSLTKEERRRQLIQEASAFAALKQKDLLELLGRIEAEGSARRTRPLWIVNRVTTEIRKARIRDLAVLDGIERISWDRSFPVEMIHDAAPPEPKAAAAPDAVAWGVEKIRAPEVWAMGYEGQGVILANIDSGADYTHPDLATHIWQNEGEIPNNGVDDDHNGFVDDRIGWDFYGDDNDPMDTYGHGTSTSGVACGDGTNGIQTGVAPKALLMILRVDSESDHMAAQQYAIENGAHAITSSYSYKWYFSPKPDYHSFRDASVMELAAGVFHNNSSSNSGTSVGVPWNVSAPALCPPPWLHPGQVIRGQVAGTLAIGGTLDDDSHYTSSPTGPSSWEDITGYDPSYPHPQNPQYWDYPYGGLDEGLTKVDVTCPTGGVPATTIGGGYDMGFSGTSAATPHAGGATCLILNANRKLSPEKICQAFKMNAKDLGQPGLDPIYGAGRVDVYEAVLNVLTTLLADDRTPALGDPVTLSLEGPANKWYAIFLSPRLETATFPGVGTFDIGPPPYLWTLIGPLDASGKGSRSFNVPNNPAISGRSFHFQSVVDDTQGSTGMYLISLHETLTIQ